MCLYDIIRMIIVTEKCEILGKIRKESKQFSTFITDTYEHTRSYIQLNYLINMQET